MIKTRTIYRHWLVRAILYPIVGLLILYTLHFAGDLLTPMQTSAADRQQAAEYLATYNLPTPPKTFQRDGCTLWPDRLLGHDFDTACLKHDIAYWAGGPAQRQQVANQTLRQDVAESGPLGLIFGNVMYLAVTWFGDNGVSRVISSHWGFGWD